MFKGEELLDVDVELFHAGVITSKWYEKKYGVKVIDSKKLQSANRRKSICLWWIACHTIPNDCAWHGREFCQVYLALVAKFICPGQAELLKAVFNDERVKWRKKREVSPKERARLKRQLERYQKTKSTPFTDAMDKLGGE
jgi:hypothetical protein